jgi:hypothetical protein
MFYFKIVSYVCILFKTVTSFSRFYNRTNIKASYIVYMETGKWIWSFSIFLFICICDYESKNMYFKMFFHFLRWLINEVIHTWQKKTTTKNRNCLNNWCKNSILNVIYQTTTGIYYNELYKPINSVLIFFPAFLD